MILIDYREETKTKKAKNTDLIAPLRRIGGVRIEQATLEYGDATFEGKGPDGPIAVGIERKGLHDILQCIEDNRLSGHQLIGMRDDFDVRVLLVEGYWRPHDGNGLLMEGFNSGMSWGISKYRSRPTMYHMLYRYLISVQLSGIIVTYSRDPFHTAFNILEWYHYFQKPFHEHTAMQEMQKIAIPTLGAKPSLTRKWANDLVGVGMTHSLAAERLFKKPITLANADEQDWLRIPGIGVKKARDIVAEIWGEQ